MYNREVVFKLRRMYWWWGVALFLGPIYMVLYSELGNYSHRKDGTAAAISFTATKASEASVVK